LKRLLKTLELTPAQAAHNKLVSPTAKLDVGRNLSQSPESGNAVVTRLSKRTRIQITVETHTVTIVRQRHAFRAWCRDCACEVDMVGLELAGFLTGLAQPVLRDCSETQPWHFSTSASGSSLVCLNSLRDSIRAVPPEISSEGKK
jgi:hypothetical protein